MTDKQLNQLWLKDHIAQGLDLIGYKPGDNPLFDHIFALLGITYDPEDGYWDDGQLYLPTASPVKVPYRCPICNGNGLVPNGFYNQTSHDYPTTSITPEPCRSCGATGVIYG